MARRTPPVKTQVIEPFIRSNARFRKRLIDFDTGSAELEKQHQEFLSGAMGIARTNSGFHVRVFGFASKLGDAKANKALSHARMNSVIRVLQSMDSRTLSSIEVFDARGESDSTGGESDNSPEFRAVEVHIFIGEIPPTPVPPGVVPVPIPGRGVIPLPGGERFKEWAVASPGGAFVAVGAGVGFNIFFIKNKKLDELRAYIQPVGGVGASLGLKGLGLFKSVIQQLLTGVQFQKPDFEEVTTKHPVTWEEMEGCLVRVSSAGGGIVLGAGFATITFSASGVFVHGPSGVPVKVAVDLFQFTTSGVNWQLGVNASIVVGPIVRID